MALNAKEAKSTGGTKDWVAEVLPPGTYPARMVSVIDMGIQPQQPYQGTEKDPKAEIRVTYELLDEFLKDSEGKELEDKPRWQDERFTMNNLSSEKAKSTIRYLSLDPTQKYEGDWSKLLGAPCMLTLIQKKSQKGVIHNRIDGVSPMTPKAASKAPQLVNEPFFFDLDEPDMESWKRIPTWLQDTIKAALNFNDSKMAELIGVSTESEEVAVEDSTTEW